MRKITLLNETELREHVQLDRVVIDAIEQAFADLSLKDVIMPPVLSMEMPQENAEVDIKTAFVPGLDVFAVKVSPGFFNNSSHGLPSLNGLMVLLSAHTGQVEALLLDNGYLTNLRTAAAGAVAARHLARQDLKTIGIIGSGMQARLQIEALRLVRDFNEVLVWSRNPDAAESFAIDQAERLGKIVNPVNDPEQLVRESDLVITTTASREPLVMADWLHPGLHITAVGSDAVGKRELESQLLRNADKLVCDRLTQSIERGELQGLDDNSPLVDHVIELGEICAAAAPGRDNERETTVCDLTGVGIQDTAIANLTLDIAARNSLGTHFQS